MLNALVVIGLVIATAMKFVAIPYIRRSENPNILLLCATICVGYVVAFGAAAAGGGLPG
ncbi:MAG TPA: hypothetical protein VGF63_06940 [Solirubrobacteraceae bacterium]|jgi:hypothetical protein